MEGILYEAIFDEDSTEGVFSISLVEKPATREMFIQLSENKIAEIKLATIDEEQRLLVGLVLEPDIPVYRNQDGEEFNIVFRKDTINKLAHNFFIGDYHKNSSIEHNAKEKITGVTFVESWLVADPKRDKSNVYGLEYPEGSWLVAMKVDSDEIWNDYVKTGKVKGFSIDAIVKLKQINNSTKLSMSTILETLRKVSNDLATSLKMKEEPKETLQEKLSNISMKHEETLKEKVEVKLGEVMMDGGQIIFEYEGETLEPGVNVFAIDKAQPDVKIPVPIGKYPLEDGTTMVVDVEGVVAEILPAEGAEEAPAPEAPAPVKEPVAAADNQSVVNDIKSILIKYQEDSEKRFKAIETQLAEMRGEVVKMAEQPNAKPKTQMAQIPLNKNGRILQALRNNKN